MTALKKALTDAGLDASKRLRDIEDRIVSETRSTEAALQKLYAAVSGDAALLWELFSGVRQKVCTERLAVAFERGRAGAALTSMPLGHVRLAAPQSKDSARALSGGGARGHGLGDYQSTDAPRPTAALDFRAARHAVTAVARTVLDTWETPLGRSIGNITGAEAKALNARSRREAKVYAYCASHTPPDELIKDFVKAKDLEAIIRAADKENEHA